MPELPDVEVQRRYLESTALHQPIADATVHRTFPLKEATPREVRDALVGRAFATTWRHGKYLFARLDDGPWLVLHFGMTGYLVYGRGDGEEPDYVRLRISFANGARLDYVSMRLLGEVGVTPDPDAFVRRRELGPDALRVDLDTFVDLLADRRVMAKAAFLDQHTLAGLGNVYADEVLFQARVHPRLATSRLGERGLARLYHVMRDVLKTAIAARADPEGMPAAFLTPVREAGGGCPRCGTTLDRVRISSRSSYYCPACQPPPEG